MSVLIRKTFILPILAYQKVISPFFGNKCKYYPSCSQYFVETVLENGLLKGCAQGLLRIVRCNPFSAGGVDEVRKKEIEKK